MAYVPGALNVSLGDFDIRISELDLVARRCRVFSARRLEDGMPECKAVGLAVEIAA
ncbi:Sulfurtransferase (fragment) [Mesorhizobium delmotii]|uniref:Sulfurtransferase n=1 Tax=Mesorhizobium delmotii TaxID=1631247 RepID=A0A2P9AJ59_9HYPH